MGGGRSSSVVAGVATSCPVSPSPSVTSPTHHRTRLRKILRSWPLAEQRAFFELELDMPLELEPDTGKLFPSSHRARDVRDMLVQRVRRLGPGSGLMRPSPGCDHRTGRGTWNWRERLHSP